MRAGARRPWDLLAPAGENVGWNLLLALDVGAILGKPGEMLVGAVEDGVVLVERVDLGHLGVGDLLLKKGEERLRDACDCAIPNEDIPRCPRCGAPMSPWVRSPEFLEGSMYREQYRKYNGFLRSHLDDNVLFLELGVGAMTPMFIKEPFWNYVYQWPGGAHYVPITLDHAIVPDEIRDKSLAFDAEIDKVLHRAAEIKRGQAFTTQSDVFKAEKQIDCSDAVDVGW